MVMFKIMNNEATIFDRLSLPKSV